MAFQKVLGSQGTQGNNNAPPTLAGVQNEHFQAPRVTQGRLHPSLAPLEAEGEEQRSWAGRLSLDTDWNDPGAVRDEVSRRDMTSLVFVAPHVKSELH